MEGEFEGLSESSAPWAGDLVPEEEAYEYLEQSQEEIEFGNLNLDDATYDDMSASQNDKYQAQRKPYPAKSEIVLNGEADITFQAPGESAIQAQKGSRKPNRRIITAVESDDLYESRSTGSMPIDC